MYVKKTCGYVILKPRVMLVCKERLDTYDPPTRESQNYKRWITLIDEKTCAVCFSCNGNIYPMYGIPYQLPPVHPNCRCKLRPIAAVQAGYGTKDGKNGADWWMYYRRSLPDYYVTEKELEELGWHWGKAPAKFAPGKMLTRGIYRDDDNRLPKSPGRIWFEADINYYSGRRNQHRLVWSNDGLLFVTYDHYQTFMEVIGEGE